MRSTFRIPSDIARATTSFLEMATRWDGMVFAGMLMRAGVDLVEGREIYMVAWEKLTPQTVADALWKLREEKGEELKAHGLTLGEVIKAWDNLILAGNNRCSV